MAYSVFGRLMCGFSEVNGELALLVVGVQGTKIRQGLEGDMPKARRWANAAIGALKAFPENGIGCYMIDPDDSAYASNAVVVQSKDRDEILKWIGKKGGTLDMAKFAEFENTRGKTLKVATHLGEYMLGRSHDAQTMTLTGKAPLPHAIFIAHFDRGKKTRVAGMDDDFLLSGVSPGTGRTMTAAPLKMKQMPQKARLFRL